MTEGGTAEGAAPAGRAARELLVRAGGLLDAARGVLADHTRAVTAVRTCLDPLLDDLVRTDLAAIPVSRLKDVTEGRLRLGAIEQAGLTTVGQVYGAGRYELRQIPGVGAQTADQALAAAGQIAHAVRDTVALRIDVDTQDEAVTALLGALYRLVEAGPDVRRAVDGARALAERLEPLLTAAGPARGRLRMLLTGRRARAGVREAVAGVGAAVAGAVERGLPPLFAQVSADLLREPESAVAAWVDFELRSAEYYSLLAELSGSGPDRDAAEGFLPSGMADRVRGLRLDDARLRVSLRGYQSFGARFALVQKRVILGDEMGLGKTVQAIAALAHLAARGETHFLVVCPASVLINWSREVRARSTLRALPVHGPERREAFAEWRETGGVAVTTFDALHTLPDAADAGVRPGMLVVDEAHYVKNPATRRSRAVSGWSARTDRVLFLTGTPMENRVEEFRSLVRQLRPELAPDVSAGQGAAGSEAFRRAVAPAYLRRNQRDVLTELPAVVQVDEWEEFSEGDLLAYREAVAAGHFMRMRRAAYARPETSAKLNRLRELVAEAAGNGLKVVVFSYFREVLDAVREALGDGVFGPLSGSVAAGRRQELVDGFAAAEGHAVLLCQIQAGGVGLNLQAASVVILCEPQIKPTTEHQAVARAHRMGQIRTVQVHRLLAADSVDQRMLDIVARKERLFDAYARRSDVAETTPDAVDVSEGDLARRVVEEEQRRLRALASP
ncbi:helicase-like protein [Streptomyces sp. KhCrAH-43]|uniref:DEAD/DEAH box helicase n=1 Tax=unclassified Streptomyces TaxID=2593676 RepID=UPI0003769826|nr:MULTISPECIES: DEAD/DEAH box helicase [unclassified Streptomyces]MYS35800.1 ATP-dependent helicase [Streptomyces sp. SID4920]MYX68877.1 ATP-dependent helicase [Streptomyces sp. SID8373]RAJ53861.1 helicase-like protein [Streptomyces sp. KhCrAH-43]